MEGMDGANLLEILSTRWPQTIRIVLSGYADPLQTRRAVPLAHQYLHNPYEPQQLEEVINRCIQLHELLHGPRLRAIRRAHPQVAGDPPHLLGTERHRQ